MSGDQPPQLSENRTKASEAVYLADRKKPGLAAVFYFLWIGLGQIYNGQLFKGICFAVLFASVVVFCYFYFVRFGLLMFALIPILWVMGI
ncbi:MAG: hypothetical protein ACXV76_04430 [Halobacteriota archaeon]